MEILLQSVCRLAEKAGRAILTIYEDAAAFNVEIKEDNSPLTQADKRAHSVIVEGLRSLTPGIPVLSEEDSRIPFAERETWERYWLVDPLDGTKEFIKRNGEFTVNIALIDNHQAVLGVVFAPVLERTYFAANGIGAYRKDKDNDAEEITVKPYTNGEQWRVVASRSHMSEETQTMVNKLGDAEMLSMGSSLKLCLVAEGMAHIYPRLALTSEWDTAAAQCVVEQAGGIVVTQQLEPLHYNSKESLLNPYFIVAYGLDDIWTHAINN